MRRRIDRTLPLLFALLGGGCASAFAADLDSGEVSLPGTADGPSDIVFTTAQEVHDTHPAIAAACGQSIAGHAATLVDDIAQAMADHGIGEDAGWTAQSLALHTQVVLQGAFVVAKATDDRQIAVDSVDHLHRYIALLFANNEKKETLQ